MGKTNASEEFLSKFPTGKVPAFETADGSQRLFESNAIAMFLANTQLKGISKEHQAEVQQWIGFAENEILPPACSWVFPILGIMPKCVFIREVEIDYSGFGILYLDNTCFPF